MTYDRFSMVFWSVLTLIWAGFCIHCAHLMVPPAVDAEPVPKGPKLYRVCLEGGVMAPPSMFLTQDDIQAINDLRSLASRWPRRLWLVSENGQLWVIKMGDDGIPLYLPDGLKIRKE